MGITDKLASSLGRKDQRPNIELGKSIARSQDLSALDEIKQLLNDDDMPTDIIADLLKTLESVGENIPELIKGFYPEIKKYLYHPKNQIVWRAMCVMAQIAPYHRSGVFDDLPTIIKIMDEGSVITRDHGINILVDLYHNGIQKDFITPLLEEQIIRAPDNQLGQYAEKWMKVIQTEDIGKLLGILEERFPDLVNEAHRKRVERIMKKLTKRINL
ncbi:MAG: hypothetical protein ACFHWX_00205 [Bacteroidota bacterium]